MQSSRHLLVIGEATRPNFALGVIPHDRVRIVNHRDRRLFQRQIEEGIVNKVGVME